MSLRRGDYLSRMNHFLFTWRDQEFEFFEVLCFYYPWLGGFFEFVFSEGLRPFLPLIVA